MMPHARLRRRRHFFFPSLEQYEELSSPTPLSGAAAALTHSPPLAHDSHIGSTTLRPAQPTDRIVVHGARHAVDLSTMLGMPHRPGQPPGHGGDSSAVRARQQFGELEKDVLAADYLEDFLAGHHARHGQGLLGAGGDSSQRVGNSERGVASGLLTTSTFPSVPTTTATVRSPASTDARLSQQEAVLASQAGIHAAPVSRAASAPRSHVSPQPVRNHGHRHTQGHAHQHHHRLRFGSALLPPLADTITAASPTATAPTVVPAVATPAHVAVPLTFIANAGQLDPRVQYVAQGPGYNLFLESNEATLAIDRPGTASADPTTLIADVVKMQFAGARTGVLAQGQDELPGKLNYLRGNDPAAWHTNVATFGRVFYPDVYDGIGLTYYANPQGQLEYDWSVAPGADPSQIQMAVQGADQLSVDASGALHMHMPGGDVIEHAPVVYQDMPSGRQNVAGQFVVQGMTVRFQVGAYDPSQPLVIDPSVACYGTFLGGSGNDEGNALAIDSTGAMYLAGDTYSMNFPTTSGSFHPGADNPPDAFVSKIAASGSSLVWSTYLGGAGLDIAHALAINSSGNVYVTGSTGSPDFPLVNPFQSTHGTSNQEVFVTEFNTTGSALVYSSYLGGNLNDNIGYGITVDASGNAYVDGVTYSSQFPTTTAAYQTTFGGSSDMFVTKVNAAGSAMVWSTYIGASTSDGARGIGVGADGTVTVSGYLGSFAYVDRLNAAGSALVWSTSVGNGTAYAVALDAAGNAFTTGGTNTSTSDAFVSELASASGSSLYSTTIAGNGNDTGFAIAVEPQGGAIVAGVTNSTNLPTVNAGQPTSQGGNDAFVARINPSGCDAAFLTYLGGNLDDQGNAIALDSTGAAYVAGTTSSSSFPTTSGALQTTKATGSDAFVSLVRAVSGTAVVPSFDENAEIVNTVSGVQGGDPQGNGFADTGVRYADGLVRVSSEDLYSEGFGSHWGQDRTWSNGPLYTTRDVNGIGWVLQQMPYLTCVADSSSVIAVTGGSNARYFDFDGTNYHSRFFLPEKLVHTSGEFQLTDSLGNVLHFNDFSMSQPPKQRGMFKSRTDPYGNVIQVTAWTTDGLPATVQRTDSVTHITETWQYTYGSSGPSLDRLTLVQYNAVRKVAYTYYDVGDPNGNFGDLKTAAVEDISGNVLDTSYYRYYLPGVANGYAHALKFVLNPRSYARAVSAGISPTTATDSVLAPYADAYFQYDCHQRVTRVDLHGAGASPTVGNGIGTYTYSYTASTNAAGYNSWAMKTVETLPDGNTNTVYSNYAGEVMLRVFMMNGNKWEWFTKYDSAGRVLLQASPSALTGYDDTKADLLNSVNGNYQYLSDNSGLVVQITYGATTTAGEGSAGDVTGYLRSATVQRGEAGSGVPQGTTQYSAHTAGGITVYKVATRTGYRNTDGTGPQTTTYTYTWYPATVGVLQLTTTEPVVTALQNGPASSDVTTTVMDSYGRPQWYCDGDGYLTYVGYDMGTSAVTKVILDVDSSKTGDFMGTPPCNTPTGGGLHLITTMSVDGLGRTTQVTDPNGNITFIVYIDLNYEVRIYPGWTNNGTTGPTQDYREDRANGYFEQLTFTGAPNTIAGVPNGTESISGLQTMARQYTDVAQQVVSSDAYFNLSGVTWSTAPNLGVLNTNYYRTSIAYDTRGRAYLTTEPTGTIYQTNYDSLSRVTSTQVGTSTSNLVTVTMNEYDNGMVGDSNLTKVTVQPGVGATSRVTQNWYDWRDRLVANKEGVLGTEDSTTHRPIWYGVLDNLDELTSLQRYDGDNVTVSIGSDGVPVAPSANLLRAQANSSFDDQGRIYETRVYSVDPSTGNTGGTLATDVWRDHRGNVIKTSEPGGIVTKSVTDGAGRMTVQYVTDGGGDSSWADAGNVTGDNVLSQIETTYDKASNPILVTDRERFHDETATGALGNATTSPKARVSFNAAYYDAVNRLTATVDVGTNGGTAWSRPSSPPAASDTVLVNSAAYNAAGWLSSVTDPRGLVTQTNYDNLARATQTIEAYTNGTPTNNTNKTTNYTYDGDNHLLTLSAVEVSGGPETTQYVYGVTTASGSGINSNDLLSAVQWPDKTTGQPSASEQETVTVDALGEPITFTDRNGSTHTYSYDVLGRLTTDAITTLGSGVDGAVRRLQMAYDTQGNAYLFTSYDAASNGNVVNQVQDAFNGLGQLKTEYQSHSGSVNTSTTPNVQYAYTEMSGGVNNSRPISLTYPNGRVLSYNYNTGIDNSVSRLSSISDSSATLETYSYLGLDTVVKRGHPQPGVDLTYIKQTGESNGDAGDQYAGLDRFGRVVDQRWLNTTTLTATDRFQYGYDRNSNTLYSNNLVNTAFGELYHANGASNGYDSLNQLTAFARGTLSDTNSDGVPDTVASPSRSQSWSTDALGNFTSVTTNGVQQTRTHNQQNEVSGIGSSTLTFDRNGNTTTDETGKTYTYDAWNRLVQAKSGGSTIATFSYDALDRRVVENYGTARDLYYSADWQVLEERVGSQVQIQNVWSPTGPDVLVERDRDADGNPNNGLEERLYVQQDGNNNVTALVNTSGNVVERYVYDAYGAPTFLTATWTTLGSSSYAMIYLSQGSRFASATGLYNHRMRDLSASLGRWMQTDPIGFDAGEGNFYRNEGNEPQSATDPNGLERLGAGSPSVSARRAAEEQRALQQQLEAIRRGEPLDESNSPFGELLFQSLIGWLESNFPRALFPSGYRPNYPPPRTEIGSAGRYVGRGIAILQGVGEIITGLGMFGGGVAEATATSPAALTVIGIPIPAAGVSVAAGGIAVVVHGAGVIVSATIQPIPETNPVLQTSTNAPNTARLTTRAEEIHSALDPIAAKQRTTAVLETTGGDIIGGGARDLNPAQRALLREGEIAAKLPGEHAEITALQEAIARGFKPKAISTTRDFCPACRKALEDAGATITGPRTAIWK